MYRRGFKNLTRGRKKVELMWPIKIKTTQKGLVKDGRTYRMRRHIKEDEEEEEAKASKNRGSKIMRTHHKDHKSQHNNYQYYGDHDVAAAIIMRNHDQSFDGVSVLHVAETEERRGLLLGSSSSSSSSHLYDDDEKNLTPTVGYQAISETTAPPSPRAEPSTAAVAITSSRSRWLLRGLVASVWTMEVLFGAFAAFHYLRAYYFHSEAEDLQPKDEHPQTTTTTTTAKVIWDQTDYALYRSSAAHPLANAVMAIHMMGGVFLMVAGPIQFFPYVRRLRHFSWHRWIGRCYLIAALVASIGATIWTLIWRTSRCNIHEDVGNLILGISVCVCAIQTYRHVTIAIVARNNVDQDSVLATTSTTEDAKEPQEEERRIQKKNSISSSSSSIQRHRLWAWRLYACILGAPLYRLYTTIYASLLLFTQWQGSLWVENGLFYTLVLPNLIVVQLLWKRQQQQEERFKDKSSKEDTGQDGTKEDSKDDDDYKSTTTTRRRRKSALLLPIVHPVWIAIALVFVVVTTVIIAAFSWIPAILSLDTTSNNDNNAASVDTRDLYHDYCQ